MTASSSTAPTATSSANSWTPTPTTAPTNSAAVPENRFRFAGECLSAIRQAVGKDYPILVKVNTNCAGEADEAYAQDILYFCRQFEALGADAIELSGYNWLGLGKKKIPTFYLDRAVQIRQAVSIPLILVGGVRGPETAQRSWTPASTSSPPPVPSSASPTSSATWSKARTLPASAAPNVWAISGPRRAAAASSTKFQPPLPTTRPNQSQNADPTPEEVSSGVFLPSFSFDIP